VYTAKQQGRNWRRKSHHATSASETPCTRRLAAGFPKIEVWRHGSSFSANRPKNDLREVRASRLCLFGGITPSEPRNKPSLPLHAGGTGCERIRGPHSPPHSTSAIKLRHH
jgi:hypothetical protein